VEDRGADIRLQGEGIPAGFIGTHDRALDDKGRLVLPSNYRRVFDEAGGGVLAPWDRCVALWTNQEFGGVVEDLRAKVASGEANRDIVRAFQAAAAEASFDSQGRFVIPVNHRVHAGIVREVKVIGQGNHVELWSIDAFNQLQAVQTPQSLSDELQRLNMF
jgi:MraZ protein